jgi:hypothetical protein
MKVPPGEGREAGGVDISASNAGVRLAGSRAASPAFRSVHRGEYMVQSSGHGKAKPLVTICLDSGCLVYGVNSRLCRVLSDEDVEAILSTVRRILRPEW